MIDQDPLFDRDPMDMGHPNSSEGYRAGWTKHGGFWDSDTEDLADPRHTGWTEAARNGRLHHPNVQHFEPSSKVPHRGNEQQSDPMSGEGEPDEADLVTELTEGMGEIVRQPSTEFILSKDQALTNARAVIANLVTEQMIDRLLPDVSKPDQDPSNGSRYEGDQG